MLILEQVCNLLNWKEPRNLDFKYILGNFPIQHEYKSKSAIFKYHDKDEKWGTFGKPTYISIMTKTFILINHSILSLISTTLCGMQDP